MDRESGWGEPPRQFEAKQGTIMSPEGILDGDFTVADLELLPEANWHQEPWRNALTSIWLKMARYRVGESEDDADPLLSDMASFMRRHDVLVSPAVMGRTWTGIFSRIDHEDNVLSIIEKLKVRDPVEDPNTAVGFLLVEGIVFGYATEIETLLVEEGVRDTLKQVPVEFATRRLVNLLDLGQAQAVLSLTNLIPESLNGLRNHPLFPKCLERFFALVIAKENDSVREEALQNFGALLGEQGLKKAAAEAVWQMMDPFQPIGDAEVVIQQFDLDEKALANASSRRWVTSRIFDYVTVKNPLTAKKTFERYNIYPKIHQALEDSLVHHISKQKMSEFWVLSHEEQPDQWVEEITKKAQHKELCWSLRMGRVDEIEHVWNERSLGDPEQREYREAALLGFREICARGRIEEAIRFIDLLKITEAETSPIVTKTFNELLAATYFEDAKRLADQFTISEESSRKYIAKAKELFLQDGDVQFVEEMCRAFGLPFDAIILQDQKSIVEKELGKEAEETTPDVLHETVRFYLNESLIATGKKIRERFAQRGLSVPFRTAMAFEPIIQAAEQEIFGWQKYVREVLLDGVVTEMIRNQNQVDDFEHVIVEESDSGSYEDTERWRARADDADVRRVLRQSVFRYGLAGWGPDRGGQLWQRVSEINLMLFSPPSPNTRAIDEAYDLVHHHGTFLIQPGDIAAVVLDVKRETSNASDLLERSQPYLDKQVFLQLKTRLSSMEEAEQLADRTLAGF